MSQFSPAQGAAASISATEAVTPVRSAKKEKYKYKTLFASIKTLTKSKDCSKSCIIVLYRLPSLSLVEVYQYRPLRGASKKYTIKYHNSKLFKKFEKPSVHIQKVNIRKK